MGSLRSPDLRARFKMKEELNRITSKYIQKSGPVQFFKFIYYSVVILIGAPPLLMEPAKNLA